MHLKKVKIFGFKSFADEITFEFGKGLTAIVGPNGCGKSNLLDAVNWVLGEQSSFRLRGNDMQDMIFKGSRTRKPLGVARVELFLDNSRDILPINYDEVSIVRKLYRSGESEYFINKNPCRLKDIKELFLDTGIGTRSYSIMEQDNVKFILESSPLERRGIIEEAAGIRKYKEKKLEAERKIERVIRDINEVKNIMAEVQKNIRRLKKQSFRASQHKKLTDELKILEVSRLVQNYVYISSDLQQVKKSGSGFQDNITSLSGNLSLEEARITTLDQNIMNFQDELLKNNQESYKIESNTEIIKNRIENFSSSSSRMNDEIERLKNTFQYNTRSIERIKQELTVYERTRDDSKNKLYSDLKDKHRRLTGEQEKFLENITQLKDDYSNAEKKLFNLKEKEIKLKNAAEVSIKLTERIKELEKTLNNLEIDRDKKTKSLTELVDKTKSIAGNIENFRAEKEIVLNRIFESESKRQELLENYHRTKSEFDSGKKYLPQLISIEKLSESRTKGIQGPISTIIGKETELLKIIPDKLSWMIAEDFSSAMQAINFLKSHNLPPLTFVIKDAVPDEEYSLSYNIPPDLKPLIGYLIKGITTEDGIVRQSECILTGGGEISHRTHRILGLEQKIEVMENNLQKDNELIEKLKKEVEELTQSIDNLTIQLTDIQNKITVIREETGKLNGSYEFVRNSLKTAKDEFKNLSAGGLSAGSLDGVIKDIAQISQNLISIRTLLEKKQTESERLTEIRADIQAKKNMLEEDINRQKDIFESQITEKERLITDNKKNEEVISDLEASKLSLSRQYEEDVKEISKLKEIKKVLMKKIGEMEEEKATLQLEVNQLNSKYKEKLKSLDSLKDEASHQKQSEERLKEKVSGIRIRLKEDMDIELDEALKDYRKELIDEEEIIHIKKEIERIGDVNLEAPEELEKELQRFDFIKGHVDDLEEADNNIRSIIRKINVETKGKFFETFNKVNHNFGKIFTQLFEGGEAKLLLTEPDNILESGIEIKVRPEGKNFTSLKLISGGESALCAIALMFAIYEVKPTPFCILDEVDSPLDDTNLHRFLRMLRDYTTNTQFIIITHNKQTMLMCDTFYGITMEEFGVSKIISVKLKPAAVVPV